MKKPLSSFINTRGMAPAVLGALASVLFVAVVTWAATTVNDNLNTDGTLTVSGASSLQAASSTSFSASNLITVSGTGTSTFSGGFSGAGITTTNGLSVTSGTLDASAVGVKAGTLGVGTTTPYQAAGVTGSIALGSGATTTVSAESTATRGGCIELRDSDGAWLSLYAGKGGATTTSVGNVFVGSSGVHLVIAQGRCQNP